MKSNKLCLNLMVVERLDINFEHIHGNLGHFSGLVPTSEKKDNRINDKRDETMGDKKDRTKDDKIYNKFNKTKRPKRCAEPYMSSKIQLANYWSELETEEWGLGHG